MKYMKQFENFSNVNIKIIDNGVFYSKLIHNGRTIYLSKKELENLKKMLLSNDTISKIENTEFTKEKDGYFFIIYYEKEHARKHEFFYDEEIDAIKKEIEKI